MWPLGMQPDIMSMAMVNTSTQNMWNIEMNVVNETFMTNQLMFWKPMQWTSNYSPLTNSFSFPDPKMFAQQIWANRPDFLNINSNTQFPWQLPGTTNNNGTNSTVTGDPKKDEYNKYRNVLIELQNLNNQLKSNGKGIFSSDEESKIQAALNKNDSNIDENIKAVKEAIEAVGKKHKDKLKKIFLSKKANELNAIGYDLKNILGVITDNSIKESDKTQRQNARAAVNAIKGATGDITEASAAYIMCAGSNSSFILNDLSHLNRVSGEGTGKSFLQLLVDKNQDSKMKDSTIWKDCIDKLVCRLSDNVAEIDDIDILGEANHKKLNDALDDLSTKYEAYKNNNYACGDKANAFVKSFNNLYGMMRLLEAKRIDSELKEQYGYLNSTVSGLIEDEAVTNATKTALSAEKITVCTAVDLGAVQANEGSDEEPPVEGDTAEEQFKTLTKPNSGSLTKTSAEGIFVSKGVNPKYYALKDGDIVELKNLKEVKANGNCVVKTDEGDKEVTVAVAIADDANEIADADDIREYSKYASRTERIINVLKNSKNFEECASKGPNGETVYRTKNKVRTPGFTNPHEQYFIIKDDGKLYMFANGGYLKAGGQKIVTTQGEKNFEDAELIEISSDEQIQTPEKEAAAAKKRAEEKQAEIKRQNEANKKKAENKKNAEALAQTIYDKLVGDTSVTEGEEVISDLATKLNKDNIYYFLKKYIALDGSGSIDGNGGICDQIDNEGDWSFFRSAFKNDTIKAEAIYNIVKPFVEWINENNDIKDNYYALKLKEMFDKGAEELRANSETVDYYIAKIIEAKDSASK